MKRAERVLGIALALALTSGIATAGNPSSQPAGKSSTAGAPVTSSPKDAPQMPVVTPPVPDPVPVGDPAMTDANLQEIRARASGMQASKRESIEKQLATSYTRVDNEAARLGEVPVRDRLAAEFGIEPTALAAQRERFGFSWGELMVAHTLLANVEGVTIEQIHLLRQEGLGWGQLAHGLQLNTSGFVTAVKNEVSVARGTAKPDGKPAVVVSSAKVTKKGSANGRVDNAPPATTPSSVNQPPTMK